MEDKTKKNKKQIKVKVRDLKPSKDAKGGGPKYTSGGDTGLTNHGSH
jgi:hypothetical protein